MGKSQKDGFSEDDYLLIGPPHLGRWSYACSKLMDEFLAMVYARERHGPVTIARLFNTVGPRQSGRYGMVLPRFIAAARAGHPGRLLAFNKGTNIEDAFGALTDEQDYTAGERNGFDVTPRDVPGAPKLVWHLLAYMGQDWGKTGGPTRSDQEMIDYLRRVNERGVVTIDVHVENGHVHAPHLKQLIAIRQALRGSSGN